MAMQRRAGVAFLPEAHAAISLNDRQRAIVNRLLAGFEGKIITSKWAKIAKCSQDTALRYIDDLVASGVLVKGEGRGRSTNYLLIDTRGSVT